MIRLLAAAGLLGGWLAAAPVTAQEGAEARVVAIPGTDLTIELRYVPEGELSLGSPEGEAGRDADEGPERRVEVSGFWMTATEITHDQFAPFRDKRLDRSVARNDEPFDVDAVTRPSPPYEDPSHGMERGSHPATGMTRLAALHYARWLSLKTGRLFTLPTEAQWEHACEAGSSEVGAGGTTGPFVGGAALDDLPALAWFESDAAGTYREVGAKESNAWGLHDMNGNVAEWVLDEYDAEAYATLAEGVVDPIVGRPGRGRGVVRGGAFDDAPERLRCAERFPETTAWKARDPQMPKSRWWNTDSPHVGFRLVSPAGELAMDEIEAYWERLLAGN